MMKEFIVKKMIVVMVPKMLRIAEELRDVELEDDKGVN